MANLPANLPTLLRKAGLDVVEIDGWETRGRPRSTGDFAPVGVLNHHTGGEGRNDLARELAYAKWMFLSGRSDLPAPLCNIGLGYGGRVYLGAAGRANHAGTARASGSVAAGDGNSLYIGIEWMISGTQRIPAAMREAAIVLNAVLTEHVTKTSVQTISCHYNTSITGKWDIGDPDGVAYNGKRVLDIAKFRSQVKAAREEMSSQPKPISGYPLTLWHASMQFSDTDAQKAQDAEKIFTKAEKKGVHWITGTEAGPGDGRVLAKLLNESGGDHGYRVYVPGGSDGWVAVKRKIITGSWRTGFKPVIPSSGKTGSTKKHGPKGVVQVSFETAFAPHVGVATSHYLTGGRRPGPASVWGDSDHYAWNKALAGEIGAWAREAGRGSGLAFYGGDQNMIDRDTDTFFGQPLTSAWDECEKYANTGHGNIDVIASYDRDGRVEAQSVRRYTDDQMFLHSDHLLVQAKYFLRDKKK